MLAVEEDNSDFRNSRLFRLVESRLKVTHRLHGEHFFAVENGHTHITPLFFALIIVELMDVVFALDSIPAIFLITQDIFVVYTSNIFAILGLRSLYFLLAAGILNIILNLFFVIVCRLSVLGVALASAISQYLSAGLVLLHLFRSKKNYSLSFGEMKITPAILKSIFDLAISGALQNAIFAVANLFIQSAVNSYDTTMVE